MEKIKVGISRCLLGDKVRYDGGHTQDHYLTDTLGRHVDWYPVCPEVECGLPVPRDAMRLVEDSGGIRLKTIRTGLDHTDRMKEWVQAGLKEIAAKDLTGFIFKSRSPSSGMEGVKIYTPAGNPSGKGAGIFASAFMARFPLLPVEDEARLHNPVLRENFLSRLFVFKRWQALVSEGRSPAGLISFHTSHKLLVLAHSPRHYTILGRLLAGAGSFSGDVYDEYISTLMEALRFTSTPRKNANVLLHMAGYFKKRLSADEKQELVGLIDDYRRGFMPLDAPFVLLRHYVRKYKEPYLEKQVYLYPHPAELMMRNHV